MPDRKRFTCTLVTPQAQVFHGLIEFAALPAHDGEIGVMRDRSPLVCKLGVGILRVRRAGIPLAWFVAGGFAQVVENRLTVLTQEALSPDAIDRAAAEQALRDARAMPMRDEQAAELRADRIARAKAQLRLLRAAGPIGRAG